MYEADKQNNTLALKTYFYVSLREDLRNKIISVEILKK
jgi:hypothetical protein